jgi:DNA-binding transcriptional MerR regulator
MKTTGQIRYQPREFARLTGVTVRTLHHYDRLCLLKPRARTASGYRLYGPEDVLRLQQIVTLKFIGFSLRQIKQLLDGSDLANALRLQRSSLEEKRRRLDEAILAIAKAEELSRSRRGLQWEAFVTIIKQIQMQDDEFTKKYYNEEAQKVISERQHLWSPELQKRVEKEWMDLFNDVRSAVAEGVQPESSRGQILANRWSKLIEGFTGGNAAVEAGVKKVWQDFESLPEMPKEQMRPFKDACSPEMGDFITKAIAARMNAM